MQRYHLLCRSWEHREYTGYEEYNADILQLDTRGAAKDKQSGRVHSVYIPSIGNIPNLYHIETVKYHSIILCKQFCAPRKFCANYYCNKSIMTCYLLFIHWNT